MRNRFDQQLQKLHDDLVQMATFIETTIGKTMSAFKTNDYALAREVYENDDVADELELRIERRSLRILLSQQPVARDLRTISTALKMITDMERICDLGKNIAEITLRFEGQELIRKPENLMLMSERCVEMVNKSVEAFINWDIGLARGMEKLDDEVDRLYRTIHQVTINYFRNNTDAIAEDSNKIEQAMDFILLSKYFERIGDHAVNIAEWVIFNITGEHKDKVLI